MLDIEAPNVDSARMRRAGKELLSLALMDARNHTLRWIAAYERARDVAKRATELHPKDPEAHLWYAITLGSWSQAKGLLHSAIALRNLRKEVEVVLQLDPDNIEAHVMAGSIDRELPVLLGGDRRGAEEHFKTAQRLDPRLTGVRVIR